MSNDGLTLEDLDAATEAVANHYEAAVYEQRIRAEQAEAELAECRRQVWMKRPTETEPGIKWSAAYADHDMIILHELKPAQAELERLRAGIRECVRDIWENGMTVNGARLILERLLEPEP